MKEEILLVRASGHTYKEIVKALGCAKSTVIRHCGAGVHDKTIGRQRDARSKKVRHIQNIKQRTPCQDCGEDYPYWVMDFDHRGDKLFGISGGPSHYSFAEVLLEIDKCDIRS